MNRDDIIRIAREAWLCDEDGRDSDSIVITSYLEHFAALVAAAEREACADIAENWRCNGMPRTVLADQIRQRGAS
jgi:hypothetical protein